MCCQQKQNSWQDLVFWHRSHIILYASAALEFSEMSFVPGSDAREQLMLLFLILLTQD